MISQSLGVYLAFIITSSAILFPIAHYVLLITSISDLENEMHALNENIKLERGEKNKLSTSYLFEINRKLGKFIRFQCDTKQLSLSEQIIQSY